MKNLPTAVAKIKQQQEFHIKSKFGEEKPYECPFCGKCLTQKQNLQKHFWTHCQNKPFQCPTCSSYFEDGNSFHRHLQKHIVSSPFKCRICSYSAFRKDYITKHEKIHQEKGEECDSTRINIIAQANDLFQNNQGLINQDASLPEEKVQQLLLPRFIETNINFKTHVTISADEEKCPDLFQNIDEAKNDISPTQKIHVNEIYRDEARSSQKFKKIKVRRLVLKPFKCIIRTSSAISKNDVTQLENSQNTSKIPVDTVHVVMTDQRVRDNLGKRVEEHFCKNCGLIFSENKDLSWHYTQDHKLPALVLLKLPISVGDIVVTE